jgi:hypothetical protein
MYGSCRSGFSSQLLVALHVDKDEVMHMASASPGTGLQGWLEPA